MICYGRELTRCADKEVARDGVFVATPPVVIEFRASARSA
jgi:hypothetical protein